MIGQTVGNYVIREQVGEGGMGVVYVAEHPQISRRVAVKVLRPERGGSPELVHRFFNEARAASEIRNEHIVDVLDFGSLPDGSPYLVMEWLEGRPLSAALRDEGKLAPARAARVVRGVCLALRAAHGKGVVHRDLKPDNVFLLPRESEPDFVKVLDFGIAKLVSSDAASHFQTQTGAIMGTPAYMSPEQCRGAKEVDARTDIYSVGVMAYQMITGRLPFVAESLGELLFKHLGETPEAPEAIDPSLPAGLSAIVMRALAKAPEDRPTLAALMAAMDAVGSGADPARAGGKRDVAPDAMAATAAAMPASSTTLGGSASELGLEHRIPTSVSKAEPRSRRGVFVAAAVGVAGVAAIGLAVGRKSPAPAPFVVTTPGPAVATAPATVQIDVRTVPSTATLTLDGAPVANPYHAEVAPDAHPHTLAAALAGHRAVETPLTYERSRDVVLELVAAEPAPTEPKTDMKPETKIATKKRAPAREAHGVRESGYRGSKLDIDTSFPGGGK